MINNEITIFIENCAKKSHNFVIEEIEFFLNIFYREIENNFEINSKSSIVDHIKETSISNN